MIHHVFANRSNIGDWLSAKAIQSLLAPAAITEYLCDGPFVRSTISRLSRLGTADLVVIGGGGLFMDYFTPFWEGFVKIASRVPFCIWGVGFCDLKHEASRPPIALLERVVGQSKLCVVRDEATRRLLQSSRLPSPVPCPSVLALERPETRGHGILHVDNYTTAGEAAYEAMVEAGRRFAERTDRAYLATNNRIPSGDEDALKATLGLYETSDVVLSSALHGCVLGVAMGRKVLAVSGDRKIEAFMESAGLAEWVRDIGELGSLDELLDKLSDQPPQESFVERARKANRGVAARVRRLLGD